MLYVQFVDMNPRSSQDDEQLRLLATGFRIVGGLCALCVNFAWIHVIVGLMTIFGSASGTMNPSDKAGQAIGASFGGIFVFAGLLVIASGYVMGYFGFKAAKAIENRIQWSLCFWTSIAFMLFQPLGLVLGILAIIVLNRPTVRATFPS